MSFIQALPVFLRPISFEDDAPETLDTLRLISKKCKEVASRDVYWSIFADRIGLSLPQGDFRSHIQNLYKLLANRYLEKLDEVREYDEEVENFNLAIINTALQSYVQQTLPLVVGVNYSQYSELFSLEKIFEKVKESEVQKWNKPPSASHFLDQYRSYHKLLIKEFQFDSPGEKQDIDLSCFYLDAAQEYLENLQGYKVLSFSNNHLKEIPKIVFDMVGLEELDLSNNRLTKIPTDIENLTELKKMDLRGNPLESFPLRPEGCEVLFDSIKKRKSPEEPKAIEADEDGSSFVEDHSEPEGNVSKKRRGSSQTDHS